MIKAKWRDGFGLYHADAQKVAEEIVIIGDEPTTQAIVDKARDENTELHKCFEWDDKIGAEKYRIEQARMLMRHLVIVKEDESKDKPEIRMFYKTDNQLESGYKQTEYIVKHEDEYQKLLEKAYAELHAFKVKYACLKELKEIFDLID